MAAPTLAIELDPGPWTEGEWTEYRMCGGTVSGRVRMHSDGPANCRRLVVTVGWHTEGRGDRDTETLFEQTLLEGEIPDGESSFAFSAVLPSEGPISYAGHYINIHWQVTARLDLAWKRDPTAQRPFFLALP